MEIRCDMLKLPGFIYICGPMCVKERKKRECMCVCWKHIGDKDEKKEKKKNLCLCRCYAVGHLFISASMV